MSNPLPASSGPIAAVGGGRDTGREGCGRGGARRGERRLWDLCGGRRPCPGVAAPRGRSGFAAVFPLGRGRPVCSAMPSAAGEVGKGGLRVVGER